MRLRSPSRTVGQPYGSTRPPAVLSFLLLASILVGSRTSAALSPQEGDSGDPGGNRADYRIHATLNEVPEEGWKRVTGDLELDWTNGTQDEVSDLWFHLYLNAFANNRSTRLHESGGRLRGETLADGWGWSNVTQIQVIMPGASQAEDVFLQYRRPDDGRQEDRTVFSVDLPGPVLPGQTVRVEIEWDSRLPRLRSRTGAKGDFLLVSGWFPKIGVYEAGKGWNCHQFHSTTEFFSDYGTYDVTLDLPEDYQYHVGGSGKVISEQLQGGRVIVEINAPSKDDRNLRDAVVHDFAWAADPAFVVVNSTFDFQTWAEDFPEEIEKVQRILGEDVDVNLRNVDVTILIHPERLHQKYRHLRATSAALFFYGLWFGEYPYEHVTVVDPAWGADAASGMEYPTLFTCGTSLHTDPDMHRPEGVIVHECGHQFWYGLVGNNEFEAAFLDEGINSYADSEVVYRVYGLRRSTTWYARLPFDGVAVGGEPFSSGDYPSLPKTMREILTVRRIPAPVIPDLRPICSSGFLDLWHDQPRFTFAQEWSDPRWRDREEYLYNPSLDPAETHGWKFANRVSYRANSYGRTAVALRTLSSVIGYDDFLRGMRHYATTWRYRHPYPEDFYATFQEGAGVDVAWYFRELFQDTGTVDWGVEVTQEPRSDRVGLFQSEGGRFTAPLEDEGDSAEGEEGVPWQITVLLRHNGEIRIDLPYVLTFEDGSTESGVWTREEQGATAWKRLDLDSTQKLKSAVLDPDRGIYLDRDMSNNQWYDETDDLAPWRWGERVLAQYQRAFHWMSGIGG